MQLADCSSELTWALTGPENRQADRSPLQDAADLFVDLSARDMVDERPVCLSFVAEEAFGDGERTMSTVTTMLLTYRTVDT